MPDYSKGKIYKIYNTINDDIYIGSTIQNLKSRLSSHLSHSKKNEFCKRLLYKTMNELGIENFYIELIENYPCDNKKELEEREKYWIKQEKSTLNICIPHRTQQEYYHDNANKILNYAKLYRENNKNDINQYQTQYRENNKEYFQQYNKQYYDENKEKLLKNKSEYKKNNREKCNEYNRKYIENNKDKIKENDKQHYNDNKDKIKERRSLNADKIKEYQKQYREKNKLKKSNNIVIENN